MRVRLHYLRWPFLSLVHVRSTHHASAQINIRAHLAKIVAGLLLLDLVPLVFGFLPLGVVDGGASIATIFLAGFGAALSLTIRRSCRGIGAIRLLGASWSSTGASACVLSAVLILHLSRFGRLQAGIGEMIVNVVHDSSHVLADPLVELIELPSISHFGLLEHLVRIERLERAIAVRLGREGIWRVQQLRQ